MRVVLNRLTSNRYPDTIKEVIADKGQFETYEEGIYQKTEPNLDSHLALGMLETTLNFDTEIIGFETKENGRALEKYYDYKFTYKDHDFYVSKQ